MTAEHLPTSALSASCVRKVVPAILHRLVRLLLQPLPDYSAIGACLAVDPALAVSAARLGDATEADARYWDFSQVAAAAGPLRLLDFALSWSLQRQLGHQEETPAELTRQWRQSLLRAELAWDLARLLTPDCAQAVRAAALIRSLCRVQLPDGTDGFADLAARCSLPEMLLAYACSEGQPDASLPGRLVALADAWASGVTSAAEALAAIVPELSAASLAEALNRAQETTDRLSVLYGAEHDCQAEQALARLANLHLLAKRLSSQAEGQDGMARILADHLEGYWGVRHFELALVVPGSSLCHFYRVSPDSSEASPSRLPQVLALASLPWSRDLVARPLDCCSRLLGEIRLPRQAAVHATLAEYLRLVSFSLEDYRQSCLRRPMSEDTVLVLPQGIARFSADGQVLDANTRFLERFLHLAMPTRTTIFSLFRERFGVNLRRYWDMLLASDEQHLRFSFVSRSVGRSEYPLIVYLSKIGDGHQCLLQITPNPETAIREKNDLIQREFFAGVVNAMAEETMVLARDGAIQWASRSEVRAGESFFDRYRPASSFFSRAWDATLFQSLTESFMVECVHARPEQGMNLLEISLTPMGARGAHHVVAVIRDLGMSRVQERTRSKVTHDALTGLFSHSHFQALFDREERDSKKKARPLGFIFLDIDRFGQFNRIYGYQTGDAILRRVAAAVKASVRPQDVVARYGRDEFAVLVPDSDRELLETLANAVCQTVRAHCRGAVDLRIGLGLCSPMADSYRNVFAAARQASASGMHEAGSFAWADDAL